MVENMADKVNATPEPARFEPARLDALAKAAGASGLPPVHLWNPPHCGDIGMKIARDGTWLYQGSPITRVPLVRLFSTILRHDPEGHVLVTPAEKVSVEVEDAPFLAVSMRFEGETLIFTTNVGDEAAVGAEHPLRFEKGPADGVKPYVLVRDDLWALVTRALVFDLAEIAQTRLVDGRLQTGVSSQGQFFVMEEEAAPPGAAEPHA
ncbi:MAG: hypothetical protein JWO64_1013 [Hyphomicrobiales bacterium]|jgi:hypothetical protein|nr:hypothetical protein [Hyphomicrobiales bacterium]